MDEKGSSETIVFEYLLTFHVIEIKYDPSGRTQLS